MYDQTIVETIEYHLSMLADKSCMQRYVWAILQAVEPWDVVLDIGSGTGILGGIAGELGIREAIVSTVA